MARDLRVKLKQGESIPDADIIKLLKDRLEMADCKTNGWILKGVPHSMEQLTLLKDIYLQPSLILSLDLSDQAVFEKFEYRRFDPITKRYYDLRDVTDTGL